VRHGLPFLVVLVALTGAGCAAVALTALGVGAGVAAGTGTGYTLDGIAYRTFSASIENTRTATLRGLKRMDVMVKTDEAEGQGRKILGVAADRTIHIELEKLTSRTTRMRVTVKQGWFWRDRSTAGEIIAQTDQALDDTPSVTQKVR
jgi:uncharacterized protein DUF3568